MLKKRLSFVEKEQASHERSARTDDEHNRSVVEGLEQEKLELIGRVEELAREAESLRAAQLEIDRDTTELAYVEERSRCSENELELLRQRCAVLEEENTHLKAIGESSAVTSQLEEMADHRLLSAADDDPSLKGTGHQHHISLSK